MSLAGRHAQCGEPCRSPDALPGHSYLNTSKVKKTKKLVSQIVSLVVNTDMDDLVQLLYFNLSNSKLEGTKSAAFSLPAGYTCPGASECLAWFDRKEGKLKDGPKAKIRCFAATIEAAFPSVSKSVDRNLALLKAAFREGGIARMTRLIEQSLPASYYRNIRVHADGDFYSKDYFLAWMTVAANNPQRLFYAYTKNLPVWVKYRAAVPANFVLTASQGGKWDNLIALHGLRKAVVVYHPSEAKKLRLKIDHDDRHARNPKGGDFALLLHGQQKAGSEASAALKRMRDEGVEYSYGRKK